MPIERVLVIFGAGGHGRVVADAAIASGRWESVCSTDRDPSRCAGELLPGVAMVQPGLLAQHGDAPVHVAIGAPAARRAESQAVGHHRLVNVIHPMASVSVHAVLGAGCFVAAQAVLAPRSVLGAGVIVNHGAVIDHDAQVGNYCHVAPQAALGGGARLGDDVFVGSGARVLPGVRVCGGTILGAGAVVCADIVEAGTYVGVPARRVR
jgi:sugar O-acyltransferase (sialic acid O-acetyltransferase NeuD family)